MMPSKESVRPGTRAKVPLPDGRLLDLRFPEGGAIEMEADGHVETVKSDTRGEDLGTLMDFGGWLILSHLAGIELGTVGREGLAARLNEILLHDVGQCPIVLRGPELDQGVFSVPVHEIPGHGSIVCSDAGIVEPITMSMFRFLGARRGQAEHWVRRSAEEDSMALLARMAIALAHLAQVTDEDSAAFGRRMLEEVVKPALRQYPTLH